MRRGKRILSRRRWRGGLWRVAQEVDAFHDYIMSHRHRGSIFAMCDIIDFSHGRSLASPFTITFTPPSSADPRTIKANICRPPMNPYLYYAQYNYYGPDPHAQLRALPSDDKESQPEMVIWARPFTPEVFLPRYIYLACITLPLLGYPRNGHDDVIIIVCYNRF